MSVFWETGCSAAIREPITNFFLMGERKVRTKRNKRTDRCIKCSFLVTYMQEKVILSKSKVFSLYTGLSALYRGLSALYVDPVIIIIVFSQSVPGTSDKEEESGLTREEIQEQERLR